MPIYEYRCESCSHELEAMQKFSDAVLTDCPSCGQPTLKKLISAAGFQLKGSGWYATDFKNSGKGGAKPTEKKSDGEAAASSSTETKKHGCGSGGCGHNH